MWITCVQNVQIWTSSSDAFRCIIALVFAEEGLEFAE